MQLSDYKRRSPEEQLADLNAAWDRIKSLARTNDEQQAEILTLKNLTQQLREKLLVKSIKLWTMTLVVFGMWEVLKFAVELILKH